MSANCSVVGIARGRKDQEQNEAMAVIVTQRRSLWEVARQVKCQMDAGEHADTLAKELLAWLLEVADQPMPNPNRCLVEIPDTFAVAHWPRDAEVAQIARCILGTLKYEPHTADTVMLRRALREPAQVSLAMFRPDDLTSRPEISLAVVGVDHDNLSRRRAGIHRR